MEHLPSLVCQSSAFVALWLFISFAAEWPVLPRLCSDRGWIWISTIEPCSAACRQMFSSSKRWKDCFKNLWFDLMIETVSICSSCWPLSLLFGKTLNLEYQMTSGHFFTGEEVGEIVFCCCCCCYCYLLSNICYIFGSGPLRENNWVLCRAGPCITSPVFSNVFHVLFPTPQCNR